jgi:hypothetical protein
MIYDWSDTRDATILACSSEDTLREGLPYRNSLLLPYVQTMTVVLDNLLKC